MGNRRTLRHVIFAVYLLLLFLLVAIKFNGSFHDLAERVDACRRNRELGYWNLNLVPFQSIRMQLRYLRHRWALINLLGNIIPFLPFGFLFPVCTGNCGGKQTFLAGLLAVLAIESFQFVSFLGSFDVDDILLNLLGIMSGYVFFASAKKTKKSGRKKFIWGL